METIPQPELHDLLREHQGGQPDPAQRQAVGARIPSEEGPGQDQAGGLHQDCQHCCRSRREDGPSSLRLRSSPWPLLNSTDCLLYLNMDLSMVHIGGCETVVKCILYV